MATARFLSTTASSSSSGGGAGLFARLGSFLVGAGLTALATEVYIFKEVREGNLEMLKKQRELEKRIAALEKKKWDFIGVAGTLWAAVGETFVLDKMDRCLKVGK